MKRLAAQLNSTILAALFSLMALATLIAGGDGAQDLAEPLSIGTAGTGLRFLGFAVQFVLARLLWGS